MKKIEALLVVGPCVGHTRHTAAGASAGLSSALVPFGGLLDVRAPVLGCEQLGVVSLGRGPAVVLAPGTDDPYSVHREPGLRCSDNLGRENNPVAANKVERSLLFLYRDRPAEHSHLCRNSAPFPGC